MKYALLILMFLSFSHAGSVVAGGYVPVKSSVSCTQENSEPSSGEVLLATCVVTNNTEMFGVHFKFNGETVRDVRVQGGSGTLGTGLTAPDYPLDGLDEYVWSPGSQTSATLDYVIQFYGKIDSRVLPFMEYASMENHF